jgi:ectoine hydroxylase-related dioxygenase (phytanoyl-CoA dioxygenase family)
MRLRVIVFLFSMACPGCLCRKSDDLQELIDAAGLLTSGDFFSKRPRRAKVVPPLARLLLAVNAAHGKSPSIPLDSAGNLMHVPHRGVSMQEPGVISPSIEDLIVDVASPITEDPATNFDSLSIEDLAVQISASERASQMSNETVEATASLIEKYGCCLLRNVIEESELKELYNIIDGRFSAVREAMKKQGVKLNDGFRFQEIIHRSKFRYDLRLKGVDEPKVDALHDKNAVWWPLISHMLGEDAEHLWSGCFISLPEADDQEIHADGGHVADEHRPAHWITIMLPLVDITMENGPTEFWPGTHIMTRGGVNRWQVESIPFVCNKGDALLFDCRVEHRGMGNSGETVRPQLYVWFKDKEFVVTSDWTSESLNVATNKKKVGFGGGGGTMGVQKKSKVKKGKRKR